MFLGTKPDRVASRGSRTQTSRFGCNPPPRVAVVQQPVYLYVPPGHQKNWAKHCARYSACGQPVYFVQERWVAERYDEEHGRRDGGGGCMSSTAEPLHRALGLKDDEHDRIVATLGREARPAELAMYGAMWSEHCSYKSSKIYLDRKSTRLNSSHT